MTLTAAVAGLAGVGSSMLVVGMIVVGLRANLRTIMRAVLCGMSVRRGGLLIRRAKRHCNRVQVLQRQPGNQHQQRKLFQKIWHAAILGGEGQAWQVQG